MKISVIVPIFNVENEIERCLKSIVDQDYRNIELILVNDKTEDDSYVKAKLFLKDYENIFEILYLEHFKNKGVSSARNTGVRHSKGDYFLFLDSDDAMTSTDVISYLVSCATIDGGQQIVFSSHQKIVNNYIDYVVGTRQIKFKENESLYKAYANSIISNIACGNLYQKEFWLMENLHFCEDVCNSEDALLLFYCCRKAYKAYLTPKVALSYFRRESSVTARPSVRSLKSYNDVTLSMYKEYINNKRYQAKATGIVLEFRRREILQYLFNINDDYFCSQEILKLKKMRLPLTLTKKFSYFKQAVIFRLPVKLIMHIYKKRFRASL